MSEGKSEHKTLPLNIPKIKAESETQTEGQLVSRSPEIPKAIEMDQNPAMSIRKRRNLSKNRGQNTRQREQTPEPGRTPVPHEDTTTSDDEAEQPVRNSREIEADNTYEEMRRLVQNRSNVKDPVYDIDLDEILEARNMAANERRRRSISPFAVPDKEELCKLQRKGSFIDPGNKLLSTNYTLSPKDENPARRNSLTIVPPKELQTPSPTSSSPRDKEFPYPLPSTPKKLQEIVYPDEISAKKTNDQAKKVKSPVKTPVKTENVFTFEENKEPSVPVRKPSPTKSVETPPVSGEIVTKVVQIERTPSKTLPQDKKPNVEVRERIVRTPSRKLSADIRPVLTKTQPIKQQKDEQQSKVPPVKPARSKSATRFGTKTSESEMSEDQNKQLNINATGTKRRLVPIPKRFMRNRSPRANRSQSVNRIEDVQVIDKTGTAMTDTGKEIIGLMQQARARSLSIPKEDPRLPPQYKDYTKNLQTPKRTPSVTPRTARGISCPKTIQIISNKEILRGITPTPKHAPVIKPPQGAQKEKHDRPSSGYIDASQSEYTSSCYSTSPSENEYEFDLSERTVELTRKLNLLSQEVDETILERETISNILTQSKVTKEEHKSVLRKRSLLKNKQDLKETEAKTSKDKEEIKVKVKPLTKARWKLCANWYQFKADHKSECQKIKMLRNQCICDLLMLIFFCGLGGMMFRTFEGSFENAYKCGTRNVKRDFIESLWRGSHYLREEDWKSMARKKLYEFENQLHTAHESGVTSYSGLKSWTFMNSFVYCLTLVTTIGYGHIAPKTFYGRVATIIYAIIGIPLFLIVLADFGKLFTRIIKFFWAFIRRFYYTRSCKKVRRTGTVQEVMKGLNSVYNVVRRPSQIFFEEDGRHEQDREDSEMPPQVERKESDAPPPLPPKPGITIILDNGTEPSTPAPPDFEIDDEFNLPISVAIIILVVYLIIGAVAYNIWETWNFFESFYFVFISMSTIGLGDLVPDHPMFMMASILYLVFGLALTSMCINVVQLKLSNTFKQASAKLGATIGLKVAEEDGSLVPLTPPPIEIPPVHKGKSVKSQGNETKSQVEEKDEKKKNNNYPVHL